MFRKKQTIEIAVKRYTGNVVFIHNGKLLEGRIFGESYVGGNLIYPEVLYNITTGGKTYQGVPHHAIENRQSL